MILSQENIGPMEFGWKLNNLTPFSCLWGHMQGFLNLFLYWRRFIFPIAHEVQQNS